MNKDNDNLDQRFIKLYQKLGRRSGFDTLSLTILAMLHIEPGELTMEDLVKKTGYSHACINRKVKILESSEFVRIMYKPSTKRKFLYMEKDFLKILKNRFLSREKEIIMITKENLPKIIEECRAKPGSNKEKEKLKILEEYYEQVLRFEKVIIDATKNFEEN